MALFGSTRNTIAQIVPRARCLDGFEAQFGDELEDLLRRLARLAGVRLEQVVVGRQALGGWVLDVRCNGWREAIRIHPAHWYFPPGALLAFLNARLAAAGDARELVAARDGTDEVVALCEPEEAAELRACIFAVEHGLWWPPEQRDEIEIELLAAIRTTPHDDGPRLVYADWLTERGDPRGQFILLQCHADAAIRESAAPLLRIHAPAWTCHLPAWMREPTFERGFVATVAATLEMVVERRAELLALAPIPRVELQPGEVGRNPGERRVATLSPDGRLLLIAIRSRRDSELRVVELPSGREIHRIDRVDPEQYGWTADLRTLWYRSPESGQPIVVQLDALV